MRALSGGRDTVPQLISGRCSPERRRVACTTGRMAGPGQGRRPAPVDGRRPGRSGSAAAHGASRRHGDTATRQIGRSGYPSQAIDDSLRREHQRMLAGQHCTRHSHTEMVQVGSAGTPLRRAVISRVGMAIGWSLVIKQAALTPCTDSLKIRSEKAQSLSGTTLVAAGGGG